MLVLKVSLIKPKLQKSRKLFFYNKDSRMYYDIKL